MSILTEYYLWIKVFHLVFVVCWMAGLFYLPRLFVYHSQSSCTQETAKTFEIMEYRLYKFIMMPSMILSLATGVFLVIIQNTWSFSWMHLKLLCVFILVVFHHLLNHWRQQLAQGTCSHQETFFRWINEIPIVLLIIIVISVIIRPF